MNSARKSKCHSGLGLPARRIPSEIREQADKVGVWGKILRRRSMRAFLTRGGRHRAGLMRLGPAALSCRAHHAYSQRPLSRAAG
jgi:hypothetical protein